MRKINLLLFLLISLASQSQDVKFSRYDGDFLSKEFHRNRRDSIRQQMPSNSVAVLFAAPERNRANDVDFQYHQDPNFYYLTGLTEPDALLLIFKETHKVGDLNADECLFLRDRDPGAEVWRGKRLGTDGAQQVLGFSAAFVNELFDSLKIPFNNFSKLFFIPYPKGAVDNRNVSGDLYDLIDWFKKQAGNPPANGDNSSLAKWLVAMREVKQPEEIVLMKKAITMSCDGHIEMMKALEPGMTEYQTQAAGEYIFKSYGSEYVGYPSICGGGENSCILHYESNRKKLDAKDVILLDMGAEYHGYSADVTRTLPVSGKFSAEQKTIYQIVYDAQEAAFKECRPGNDFNAPHRAAAGVIKRALADLGIIKDISDYRKYFMHSTSHYLGLDVHDAGTHGSLKSGNVITVEPGIYIPDGSPCDPKWWNIGIRIEDDILITETGYENLSVKAPRSIEKVEEMMKQKSIFDSRKQ